MNITKDLYDIICWEDENFNKWSCDFFTKKEAIEASKTLKDCVGCLDCIHCWDCKYCTGCLDCKALTECCYCFDVEELTNSKYNRR